MKKANNVKRIKTISAIKKKPRLESESDVSSKEQENTVNITINNNIPKKNKSKHYSKYTYIRHKTAYFEPKEDDISEMISRIITKNNVQNLNININYNEIQRKNSFSVEKKNASTLWKKTRNVQKMVNAFLHPTVEKISDDEIFDVTLKNTLLGKKGDISIMSSNDHPHCQREQEITFGEFMRKTEVEKEFIRINLKEKAFKLITDGPNNTDDLIASFEKLFNKNPEKNRYSTDDKNYLFNQLLSNGKTILYIACQEGTVDIVKYLLSKNLNPNIKSKYFNMEDTCLWVACRWNYYDIVKLLLETNQINEEDIIEELNRCDCNKKIMKLLYEYLPLEKRRNKKGCACF